MTTDQLYFVGKYFDDHLDLIIQEGLSKEDAQTLRDSLVPGTFISYEIKPMGYNLDY